MKRAEDLKWHFREHGSLHVLGFGILAMVLLAVSIAAWLSRTRGDATGDKVEAWPKVHARIVSSEIHEFQQVDKYSHSTILSVSARFSVPAPGAAESTEISYRKAWTREDLLDWSALLAPGKSLEVRVSPGPPYRVSLWDHNGVR